MIILNIALWDMFEIPQSLRSFGMTGIANGKSGGDCTVCRWLLNERRRRLFLPFCAAVRHSERSVNGVRNLVPFFFIAKGIQGNISVSEVSNLDVTVNRCN